MTKPYKCRVEYLESSGTQYIDTGIAPSNITPIAKLKFIPTQQYSSGNYGIFGCWGANNTRFQVFYNSIGIGTYVSKSWQANTTYEVELNGKIPSATINGTVETTGYSNANGFSSDNMYLFTRNNGDTADNGVPLKLYYCKIWNNDTLVRDFIPVLDNNGRPALYDNVSGQLFYNLGSGEFTYGRKIIPVEYLESTGTQYIDTGIKGKNNIDFDYKCVFTNLDGTAQCVGGNWSGASTSSVSLYLGLIRTNGNYAYHYDGTPSPVVVMNTTVQDTPYSVQGHMWTGEQYMVINGTKSSVGTISSTFTSSLNMYLFGINNNGLSNPAYMKLYSCKIWDNNTLVRDYIPCIDENNVPFMFDLVNCKIYENAGTGEFKVGANVEKSGNKKFLRKKLDLFLATLKKKRKYYCEVEYLEGTGTQYIDTGLDYFADFEIGIKLRQSVSNKALGNGAYFCMQRYNAANPYWYFSTGTGTSNSYITSTPITEHHVMKWKDNKIYADDVLLTEFTKDLNTPNKMYLFSADGSNKYPNMIYFCKLWEPNSGLLVRDFIPVLDFSLKPCMYDKVSGKLFYNKYTSGNDFSYGREIHYVDYLESTGTQYIDTGIIGDLSTEINCEAAIVEAGNASVTNIMGNNVTNTRAITINMSANIANPSPSRIRFSNTDNTTVAGAINLNTFYKYNTNKDNLTVKDTNNNVLNTYAFNATTAFTTDGNILIYKLGDTSTQYIGKIKVSRASIKNSGVLVRDFIPAIDSDGVGYMFDKVTHTIYDNAGTGVFKYPAREVEYLYTGDDIAAQTSSPFISTSYRLIDTNETIDLTSVVEMKFAFDKNIYYSGCGARNNSSNMTQSIYFPAAYSTLNKFGWTIGSGEEQRQKFDLDTNDHTIKVDLPNATVTWDDVSYPIANLTYTASTRTFPLFAFSDVRATQDNNYRFPMQGKIYYAKFWKNGVATKDFIPCYKDGVACMVDKLTGTAYLNQGTGTFTTGKIIEPEYES